MFKGSLVDLMVIMVIFFIFAFSSLIALKISNQFEDTMQKFDTENITGNITSKGIATFSVIDDMGGVLLIGLGIGSIISAFFVKSHPIIFFVLIILLAIIIVISTVISNTYMSIVTSSSFADEAGVFDMIQYIFSKYAIIIGMMGIAIVVALLSKGNGGGYQQV